MSFQVYKKKTNHISGSNVIINNNKNEIENKDNYGINDSKKIDLNKNIINNIIHENTTENMKEIEQRNYIFGHLINSYKNKGIKIPSEFFYNDIYKDSGLLLCKKSKMEDFFEQDAIKVGGKSKKGAKSLKFLGKISNDVEKEFKKRLLNIKNKNINYSISSET